MNQQYLSGRAVSVTYALKKDSKTERHGSMAERILAANNPFKAKVEGGYEIPINHNISNYCSGIRRSFPSMPPPMLMSQPQHQQPLLQQPHLQQPNIPMMNQNMPPMMMQGMPMGPPPGMRPPSFGKNFVLMTDE
jgi:splicing factor 3B subunit 4